MRRTSWYLPFSLAVVVGAAITALLLMTYRGVTQTRGLLDTNNRVVHSHQVLDQLHGLLLDITTAESAVRGFLLTGDQSLLTAYADTRATIEPSLGHVRQLMADNPAQQQRLAELTTSVRARIDSLDTVVRANREGGVAGARALVGTGNGREQMAAIRRTIAAIDAEEQHRLDTRLLDTATYFRRVVNNLILSGAVALLLVVAIAMLVNAHLGVRARSTAALMESERRYRAAAGTAERANVLKDEFLAILSHELRTPLNAVLGWTQMLRAGSVKGAAVDRAVAAIDRNARAQQRLVEDLLDVSRIVTGKFDVERKPMQLAAVVTAAVEAQRPVAFDRGLDLQLRISGAPIVNGDVHRAQQAIGNLLSNALKFTPEGGSVLVELTHDQREATLLVRDTGRGIAPDLLPFIFDRFRQGDSSTKRAHSGLGLGLAIVRHIVELHGGSVVGESAGENQGATFTVTLPLLDAGSPREPAEQSTAAAPPRGALAGVAVVLVDDNADSREMIGFALQQQGARVTTFATAAAALASIAETRPTAVLTDLQMPDIDGFDLLRRIQAVDAERDAVPIPVIAVTAHARPEDADAALAAGFAAYLTKPVDVARIIQVLGAATGVAPRSSG